MLCDRSSTDSAVILLYDLDSLLSEDNEVIPRMFGWDEIPGFDLRGTGGFTSLFLNKISATIADLDYDQVQFRRFDFWNNKN